MGPTFVWCVYRQFGSDNIKINTYVQHPGDEGGRFARDTTSFDVWGPGGRMGEARQDFFLPPKLGRQIYDFLFEDPNPPDIDWIIYEREMWTHARRRKQPFGFDAFTFHDDHIHVTYLGRLRASRLKRLSSGPREKLTSCGLPVSKRFPGRRNSSSKVTYPRATPSASRAREAHPLYTLSENTSYRKSA